MKYLKIEDAYAAKIYECNKIETKLFSFITKMQQAENDFVKKGLLSQIELLKTEYAHFNIYKIKSLI